MTELATVAPPAVLVFVAAAVCLVVSRRTGHAVAIVAALATVAWIGLLPAGTHVRTSLFGFDVVLLNVDGVSRTVGLVFGYIAAAGSLYAYATDADARQATYALAYVGSCLGAVFAGDWLTLVIFWELMAVWATLLLWHGGGAARRAGFRYAIYHEIGGAFLMAAVLLRFARTGTFLFGEGFGTLAAVLAAVGIGLNAGFVGLHVWMVDSYPRPHVAASVILAAFTTKVGAYTLVRAFPGGNALLAYLGGAMVLVGVTMAILQVELRRLLTYHVVSQVGYMVAGVGVGSGLAVAGAFGHLLNHVLYKSLLFMVAGVVLYRTGTENLKRLGGLARSMPVAFGLFLVAAAAITGVPGTNGFVTKGMILDGVEAAGLDSLWWVLTIGAVGTVISFTKFGYYAFLGESPKDDVEKESGTGSRADQSSEREASRASEPRSRADVSVGQGLAMGVTAALCIALGLLLQPFFAVLPGDPGAAKPFSLSPFLKAGGLFAAGFGAFVVLRGPLRRVTHVPDLEVVLHPLGARLTRGIVLPTARLGSVMGEGGARLARRFLDGSRPAARERRSGSETVGDVGATGRTDDLGEKVLLVALTLVVVLLLVML